jgi:hypothetical protein
MQEKVSLAGKLRGVDYALSVRIVGRLNEYKLEIVKVTANSSHKHGKTDDLVPRGNNASAASNSGRRLDARARRRPVRTAVEQEALPGEDRRQRPHRRYRGGAATEARPCVRPRARALVDAPDCARQPAWANQLSSLRRLSLSRLVDRADARTRTGDPFITREVKSFAEGWRRVAESGAEQGDTSSVRSLFGLAAWPGFRAYGHGLDTQRPA